MSKGIGIEKWSFHVYGSPTDCDWRYLVEDILGTRKSKGSRPAWTLNPDYQRGPVWTHEQQERFIGHVLGGGLVSPLYVQRYEGPKNAPAVYHAGDAWLDLPNEVIDGQQRLRAIVAFITGEIAALVYHSGDWHRYFYEDLDDVEKRSRYLTSKIVFVDLPRADRLRFYLRLNGGGTPHSEEELDRVRKMLVREEG
jgi:hypothetical protein